MELDLQQFAKARARGKTLRGGMHYLLARVRRELEERWHAHTANQNRRHNILLLDFDGGDFCAGARDEIKRISPLEHAHADFAGAQNFDGVVMCLQPAWMERRALFAHARRALREGGALLFCTCGPDTLAQVRDAWRHDSMPHVHAFTDMHIIGDELLRAGFARPIVDVDRVTVEYHDAHALHADLRGEGFTNILHARRKTLTGARRGMQYRRALEDARAPGGALGVTFELIYAAAFAPHDSVRVSPPQLHRS